MKSVPDSHQPYALSQPNAQEYLNKFWLIYGLSEGPEGMNGWDDGPLHPSVFWYEWNMLKLAWNGHSEKMQRWQRDLLLGQKINGLNASNEQADGFLWPEPSNPRWFGLQYHFDHIPRYIIGAYLYYVWSGDRDFLKSAMPMLRAVMGFLWNGIKLSQGIAICPGNNTGLPNTGEVTTYMDCIRSGYIDGWTNTAVYTALQNMAELEAIAGDPATALRYRKASETFVAQFDKQLWNPATKRYAGWRDIKAKLHDCGYTYINIEALARGLGDAEKARCIFNWLDHGKAQPVWKGGHIGSTDIYQLVVAPRANTIRIPNEEWDGFSHVNRNAQGKDYIYAYGGLVEDGGTMLWMNYYDVLARLRWLDADHAYRKLTDMLYRCANDSRFLSFGKKGSGNWRSFTDFGEHFLALGTNYDFPESGLAAMSMLYGFMGVLADTKGLYVQPNLPRDLISAQCSGIRHRGKDYTLSVERGSTVMMQDRRDTASILAQGKELVQKIHIAKPFDLVGVFTGNFATQGAEFRMTLLRLGSDGLRAVACQQMRCDPDNTWQYLPVDGLPTGDYQIVLSHVKGRMAWHQHSVEGFVCCAVSTPVTPLKLPDISWRASSQKGCLELRFTAKQPFCRVAVPVIHDKEASCRMSLLSLMGSQWQPVQETYYPSLQGVDRLLMDVADQPLGDYRLIITPSGGQITPRGLSIFRGVYTVTANERNSVAVPAGTRGRVG
ncbi:MAG: glucosidase family protein [Armatimonadota bacterium]